MKLKTGFWNKREWQEQLERISFAYGIFTIANLIAAVILKLYPLIIVNIPPLLLTIFINQSHKKWKNENNKN